MPYQKVLVCSSGRHEFQVPLLHFPGLQPYALTYTLHTRLAGEKLSLNNQLESTVLPMEYEILSPKRGPGILSLFVLSSICRCGLEFDLFGLRDHEAEPLSGFLLMFICRVVTFKPFFSFPVQFHVPWSFFSQKSIINTAMVTWICRHIITYAHPDCSTPSSESKLGSHCYGTWLSPITGQNDDHFKSQKNGGNQRNPLRMEHVEVFRCPNQLESQNVPGFTMGCKVLLKWANQGATFHCYLIVVWTTLVKVASFRVFPNTFSTSSCFPKPQMSWFDAKQTAGAK